MDEVYEGFLEEQCEEIMPLAAGSDRLIVQPLPDQYPPSRYLVRFQCTGALYEEGEPQAVDTNFDLGIWLPNDYLRRAHSAQVLSWLSPRSVWHPNIGPLPQSPNDPMFICVGRLVPGTPLVDLIYQCWEIITFNKVTMREDDALNKPACAWARANQTRFPLDPRPLRRPQFAVETIV
jgi:hypothetical protein